MTIQYQEQSRSFSRFHGASHIFAESLTAQEMVAKAVKLETLVNEGLIFVNQYLAKSGGPTMAMHHCIMVFSF